MAFVWHFIQANAITYRLDYQLVNYNYGISANFSIIFFWIFDYINSAGLPVSITSSSFEAQQSKESGSAN
jgi:hypothetical protein